MRYDMMRNLRVLVGAPLLGVLCVLCLGLGGASAQGGIGELEDYLFDLEGVRFRSLPAMEGFAACYALEITQPVDHTHPEDGRTFQQRVFLAQKDEARPTVLVTEGYSRGAQYPAELTTAIGANQLIVEHRYYGTSIPEDADYAHLNIEQAAADLHHIRTLFADWFTGPWLASGVSKGGQTTTFYRYFYPEDVAVSVPYVAPINLSLEDPRIYEFLRTHGDAECREGIAAVQRRLLEEREASLLRLKWFAKGEGSEFGDYLTFEEAFEYAVLEYPFSFWQWGASCGDLPDPGASLDEVLDHFLEVSGVAFFSDESMEEYASHYYQCAREFGYYGYEVAPFSGQIQALTTSPNPSAIFVPPGVDVAYDGGALARTVWDWAALHADQFLVINGADDTWSATGLTREHLADRDALVFLMEGQHHGSARIKNLGERDQRAVVKALERWLEAPVTGWLQAH